MASFRERLETIYRGVHKHISHESGVSPPDGDQGVACPTPWTPDTPNVASADRGCPALHSRTGGAPKLAALGHVSASFPIRLLRSGATRWEKSHHIVIGFIDDPIRSFLCRRIVQATVSEGLCREAPL